MSESGPLRQSSSSAKDAAAGGGWGGSIPATGLSSLPFYTTHTSRLVFLMLLYVTPLCTVTVVLFLFILERSIGIALCGSVGWGGGNGFI